MLRDNPRVHDTRQTENLRENWILRQRNRECNNSPFVISRWFSWGKTGNKKAVWCVQTALKQKKWWQGPGSNWWHEDFQSSALPTELPRHFGIMTLSVMTVLIYTHFAICQAGFWKKMKFFLKALQMLERRWQEVSGIRCMLVCLSNREWYSNMFVILQKNVN